MLGETVGDVPDDVADTAASKAVSMLYPFIGRRTSVLDIGSGWCGPLRQLETELNCSVTGITISGEQQAFCEAAGHSVKLADAEQLVPTMSGHYDVALMLESISHIKDRRALLAGLTDKADKLVIRANTYDGSKDADVVFGDSMALPSTAELRADIEASGWTIVHAQNIRPLTHPTLSVYQQRLAKMEPSSLGDGQLSVLWDLVQHHTGNHTGGGFSRSAWQLSHGLVDLVAVPTPTGPTGTPRSGPATDCALALTPVLAEFDEFLRSTSGADALARHGDVAFNSLMACVARTIPTYATDSACPDPAALRRQLVLPSIKIADISTGQPIINRNRYTVFLDTDTLGPTLQRRVLAECAPVIGVPASVQSQLGSMPQESVAALGVEWPAPYSSAPATGRLYFQSSDDMEPIASWEWDIAETVAMASPSIVSRTYERLPVTECHWQNFSAGVLDSSALSRAGDLTGCWEVRRGAANGKQISKYDLKLSGATLRDVLPALRFSGSHIQTSIAGSLRNSAVPLVSAARDGITLYLAFPVPVVALASGTAGCVATPGQLVAGPDFASPVLQVQNFDHSGFQRIFDQSAYGREVVMDRVETELVTFETVMSSLAIGFDQSAVVPPTVSVKFKRAGATVAGPGDLSEFTEAFSTGRVDLDGLSAVVQNVDELPGMAAVKALKMSLQASIKAPVNVNLYLSAPGSSALPAHTDRYDVFVIQLHGTKAWEVCVPSATKAAMGLSAGDAAELREIMSKNPTGCSRFDAISDDASMVCEHPHLAAGDMLYMPKGVAHRANATSVSVHLTIGVIRKDLTWKDLFEDAIAKVPGVKAQDLLETHLAKIVNAVPAGVAWRRAVPMWLVEHALTQRTVNTELLYDYFIELANQLKQSMAQQTPSLGWAATDHPQLVIDAIDTLLRTDSITSALATSAQRARTELELRRQAAEMTIGLSNGTLGRSRRQSDWGSGCWRGRTDGTFECHTNDRQIRNKDMRNPIDEGCDCDSYYGGSCDCDTSGHYGSCRTPCEDCVGTCNRGFHFSDCNPRNAVFTAGVCRRNGFGMYCNSDVAYQCADTPDNSNCLGGFCADTNRVTIANCLGAAETSGLCVDHMEGYTGTGANRCAPGYYRDTSSNDCVPTQGHGNDCDSGSQCASGSCKGGQCCHPDAAQHFECQACNTQGSCQSCRQQGYDPRQGCNGCLDSHYNSSASSATRLYCRGKESQGGTCRNDDYCRSNDCRCTGRTCDADSGSPRYCCAENVRNGQDTACVECGRDGQCSACLDGFSIPNGDDRCHRQCLSSPITNTDGEVVFELIDHGEEEEQMRWRSESPEISCSSTGFRDTYTRECNDGTWSDWQGSLNLNPPLAALTCTDTCQTPRGFRVYVCDRNETDETSMESTSVGSCQSPDLGGEFCSHSATMMDDQVVARLYFERPFVQPGERCRSGIDLRVCNGAFHDAAGRADTPGRITQIDSCQTQYQYVSCYENCARDCNREMQIDINVCHPECNVASCDFQNSHCADMLKDNFTAAHHEALQVGLAGGNPARAVAMAEAICQVPIGDEPSQRGAAQSACNLVASLNAGLDAYGRNRSFVFPLQWNAYAEAAREYIELLESHEDEIESAVEAEQASRNQQALMQKVGMLSMDIDSIQDQIVALDLQSRNFNQQLNERLEEMDEARQHEYREITRELGALAVGQGDLENAIDETRYDLLEQDRTTANQLRDLIQDSTALIRNDIADTRYDVLRGQGALMDQINENRVILQAIQSQVNAIRSTQLEMQEQLLRLIAHYEQERQAVVQKKTVSERFFARFDPDRLGPNRDQLYTGFDLDGNGNVSASELVHLMDDFDIIHPAALQYFRLANSSYVRGRSVTTVDLSRMVASLGPEYSGYVRTQTGLNAATMDQADTNGDGTIDPFEALRLMSRVNALSQSAVGLADLYDRGQVDNILGWQHFGCLATGYVRLLMERASPVFSIAAVEGNVLRLTGIIEGIKQLIDVISDTLAQCVTAAGHVLGAIVGIFTGNIGAVVSGVQGAMESVPACVTGIGDAINSVKSTFTAAKLEVLELVDQVRAGITWVQDWFNPPALVSQCARMRAAGQFPDFPGRPITFDPEAAPSRPANTGALDRLAARANRTFTQLDQLIQISNRTRGAAGRNATGPGDYLPSNDTNLLVPEEDIENMRNVLAEIFNISTVMNAGVNASAIRGLNLTQLAESERFINGAVAHADAMNSWYLAARSSNEIHINNELLLGYLERANRSSNPNVSPAVRCRIPFPIYGRSEVCPSAANDPVTREPLSFERQMQLRQQIPLQRANNVVQRLLELVYKEKRQLEFKWLEPVNLQLQGLTARDFREFQAALSSWNQAKLEAEAASTNNERLVSYTFFKEDFPQEFSKLGQTRRIELVTGEVIEVQEVLVLPIEPPTYSGWHGAFYTNVQVFLLPLETDEPTIPVRILKEGTSVFFREDGSLRNAERFLHQTRERLVDYFTEDCAPSSSATGVLDLIRFSPYGTWKLMVPQQFRDLDSLAGVDQIRFEFTIRAATTTIPGANRWPLFANDRVSPDSHSVLRANADAECTMDEPTVAFGAFSMLTPLCDAGSNGSNCIGPYSGLDDGSGDDDDEVASSADGSADEEDSAMSAGAIAGIVIAVLLAILIVVAIVVRSVRQSGKEHLTPIGAFMNMGATPDRGVGVMNPTYVSVHLPPSPTVSSLSGAVGSSRSTIYGIPMADGNIAAVSQDSAGYGVANALNGSPIDEPAYAETTSEGLAPSSGTSQFPRTRGNGGNLAASSETARYPRIIDNNAVSNSPPTIGTIGPGDAIYGNQVVVNYHDMMADTTA